jgi:multidrug efflux pump subunit AcrA (membrane-fusion protein)
MTKIRTSCLAALTGGAVVTVLALVLPGCAAGAKSEAPDKKKAGARERRYLVSTAQVSVRPLSYELEATGTLVAKDIFRIDAQVLGTVEDVAFNEGDRVTPQTVLCRI